MIRVAQIAIPDASHPGLRKRLQHAVWHLRLDRIPHLWSVIRGDLELVGPSLRGIGTERMGAAENELDRRFSVRPGLVGLGALSNRIHGPQRNQRARLLGAESLYIDNKSVGYDVQLILWTAMALPGRVFRAFFPRRPASQKHGETKAKGAASHHVDGWSDRPAPNFQSKHSSLPWRLTQRILALAMLIAVSPVMLIVFALVKTTSPGPFLFKQRRRGFEGKPFEILKVRTLSMGAEASTTLGVQNQDPTVTKVGGKLRALKLDELPQLWNVVRGDMEFVGPRPIPMGLEDELNKHIPNFGLRHQVKPGLTNVAQVSVFDNETGDRLIQDWSLRAEAERHYVANKSFAYDVVLMALTGLYVVRKMLHRGEAAPVPEHGIPSSVVLGTPVSNLDYGQVVDKLADWVQSGKPSHYVCISPVHSIVEAVQHEEHRKNLSEADIVTADGMPIVWAQKILGHGDATRVYGPTLMLKALERAQKEGWRMAFYGGHPERLEQLKVMLSERYPDLQIVYSYSPPFRALTTEEDEEIVREINATKPDLVWVGLGCPKQERWMNEHKGRVRGVLLGVGAAFDFHAGVVRQAPPVLQRMGLEWAFRLCCEPRRLFRRYATTNPIFVLLFGWQTVKRLVFRRNYQIVK